MRTFPDFANIAFDSASADVSYADWRARFEAETGKTVEDWAFKTLEQIDLQPLYTKSDIAGCEHLDSIPGIAPYVRGPYGSMYVTKPWTVRQYAGIFHGRGVERLLSAQYRRRPTGPIGRVRPPHASRLRFRPS